MVGEVERDCISYMCAKNEEKEGEARKGEAWESGEVIAALVGEDHVQQRGWQVSQEKKTEDMKE